MRLICYCLIMGCFLGVGAEGAQGVFVGCGWGGVDAEMAEDGVAGPEDGADGEVGEAGDVVGDSEVADAHVGVMYIVLGMWLI